MSSLNGLDDDVMPLEERFKKVSKNINIGITKLTKHVILTGVLDSRSPGTSSRGSTPACVSSSQTTSG